MDELPNAFFVVEYWLDRLPELQQALIRRLFL